MAVFSYLPRMSGLLVAVSIAGPLAPFFSAPALASKIGVASAVKNQVQGSNNRALSVGSDVFTNERVRTGAESTAQLLFLDKTSLSIGPQAELVLDKFVYNPNRGSGEVVLSSVKGAFRFVSGSQDPRHYTIKTPVATLGVRGTVVDYLVQNGKAVFILVQGAAQLTIPGGKVVHLTKPGTVYVVHAGGKIEGPLPNDGTIVHAFGNIAFPLYGWFFQGDPQNPQALGRIDNIDQLNAIVNRGTPPVVNNGSTGGGGGSCTLIC
ncbi:MAG: FecR domain-containing protein [Pseudorhodoplanes sp.]|nr:FecR domain-containing protein [Pseudorhodoplanes sp.]